MTTITLYTPKNGEIWLGADSGIFNSEGELTSDYPKNKLHKVWNGIGTGCGSSQIITNMNEVIKNTYWQEIISKALNDFNLNYLEDFYEAENKIKQAYQLVFDSVIKEIPAKDLLHCSTTWMYIESKGMLLVELDLVDDKIIVNVAISTHQRSHSMPFHVFGSGEDYMEKKLAKLELKDQLSPLHKLKIAYESTASHDKFTRAPFNIIRIH